MSGKSVLFHIDATTRVATVTLNRPDKLNSFTREMHIELNDALNEVEASNARAVIITGAGRGFARVRIWPISTSRKAPRPISAS